MTKELSPREIEIMKLVAEGRSYKKIAYTLEIALPTVKLHVSNARIKLGAFNTPHAVTLAVTSGILTRV